MDPILLSHVPGTVPIHLADFPGFVSVTRGIVDPSNSLMGADPLKIPPPLTLTT